MRFLADMGVSQRIVEWLRADGHDVAHLREQGLQRLPNGQIFAKAALEGRVILTYDLDFGDILAAAGPASFSFDFTTRDPRMSGSDCVPPWRRQHLHLKMGPLWWWKKLGTASGGFLDDVARWLSALRASGT